MEHEHVIHGLIRKRAEIAGHIDAQQDKLRALQTDLSHVDATLRLFQPGINLSGVKVRPVPGHAAALYGEMTKALCDVLRDAPEPMAVRPLALAVMAAKGLAGDDGALVGSMHQRVGSALRTMKARGTAESLRGKDARELVWKLTTEQG